jgi:hypothetical protein
VRKQDILFICRVSLGTNRLFFAEINHKNDVLERRISPNLKEAKKTYVHESSPCTTKIDDVSE